MKNYLAIYLGSPDANAKMEVTDAQKMAGMDKWMKWTVENASAIVDLGSPLGKTKKINAEGVSDTRNRLTAYTIIQAEFSRCRRTLVRQSCALHRLSGRLCGGHGMPSDTGNVILPAPGVPRKAGTGLCRAPLRRRWRALWLLSR